MHSHDRTILSSFGFADPDKKDRRHDLACQYLASKATSEKLVQALILPLHPPFTREVERRYFRGPVTHEFDRFDPPLFEEPIVKGEGKYRTVVGFLDVILPYKYRSIYGNGESREYQTESWESCDPSTQHDQDEIVFEVKINPVGTGDIIRQINLYRQFYDGLSSSHSVLWCVPTAFSLAPSDVATLRAVSIRHIRLGDAFEAWCESGRMTADDSTSSIEL